MSHGSELARDHRRRLHAAGARGGDRKLDRLGRDRGDRRAARRRCDRRPGLLALDLRAQRPARACDRGTRARSGSRFEAGEGTPRRLLRGRAVRGRARGDRVCADRAAALRLEEPRHPRAARRRHGRIRLVPRVRAPRRRADAAARTLLASQLRGRERGDARHVRRTRDPVLLPDDLPTAGRR